jgi:hypothetical protein
MLLHEGSRKRRKFEVLSVCGASGLRDFFTQHFGGLEHIRNRPRLQFTTGVSLKGSKSISVLAKGGTMPLRQ